MKRKRKIERVLACILALVLLLTNDSGIFSVAQAAGDMSVLTGQEPMEDEETPSDKEEVKPHEEMPEEEGSSGGDQSDDVQEKNGQETDNSQGDAGQGTDNSQGDAGQGIDNSQGDAGQGIDDTQGSNDQGADDTQKSGDQSTDDIQGDSNQGSDDIQGTDNIQGGSDPVLNDDVNQISPDAAGNSTEGTENGTKTGQDGEQEMEASDIETLEMYQMDVPVLRARPIENIIDSGELSNGVMWKVTQDGAGNKTLIVFGEGPIPDYAQNDVPWRKYAYNQRGTVQTIIIGDGITKIGSNAFHDFYTPEVIIGSGVKSIGHQSFGYMYHSLKEITIPGNVETLANAFDWTAIESITLEEGIKNINLGTLFWETTLDSIDLPSTVTSISGRASTRSYTVAEGNPMYYAVDGVLYKYLTNETGENADSALYAYPNAKSDTDRYVVPENVKKIYPQAFGSGLLNELIIPATATEYEAFGYRHFYNASGIVKISMDEGVRISNTQELFRGCSKLEEVTLPSTVKIFGTSMFENCTSLRTVTIPQQVTQVTATAFSGCSGLEEIIYDAENCTNLGCSGASPTAFRLIVGEHVDFLPSGFSSYVQRAESIQLTGPNWITVAEGALNGAPGPLNGLSGIIYIDENGIIYKYDEEAGTASVVYCPDGLTTVQIPSEIPLEEEGKVCKVTKIGDSAFTQAESLESISFDAPEAIIAVGEKAFYGCQKLSSVNGETTRKGAAASFSTAKEGDAIGRRAFDNTALEITEDDDTSSDSYGEDMTGRNQLIIEGYNTSMEIFVSESLGENSTIEWKGESETEKGGYHLLTGDVMPLFVKASNTPEEKVRYRIYFDMTEDNGYLNIPLNGDQSFDDKEGEGSVVVARYPTNVKGISYAEFTLADGQTGTFPVTLTYPSPTSGGGGVKIWGMILTEQEAEENSGKVLTGKAEDGYVQGYWTTVRDPFKLTKTNGNQNNSVNISYDNTGKVMLVKDLVWTIKLQLDKADPSSYGKDYVKTVNYDDTIVLPEGISWNPEILEEIEKGNVHRYGDSLYVGNNTRIGTLSISGGAVRTSADVTLEEGNVHIKWRVRSSNNMQEMAANTITLTILRNALTVDQQEFGQDTRILNNSVEATVGYTYSGNEILSSSVEKQLVAQQGNLAVTKTASSVKYFGEDINYTIRAYNYGAFDYVRPADSAEPVIMKDAMPNTLYIKPENLERMFEEEGGENLTVVIANAKVAASAAESVTGIDGGKDSSEVNFINSDLSSKECSLTIRRVSDDEAESKGIYQVTAGDQVFSGNEIAELLEQSGYAVSQRDQYTVKWSLKEEGSEEPFVFESGKSQYFAIYATVKNTFQLLTKDQSMKYQNEKIRIGNTAGICAVKNGKETGLSSNTGVTKDNIWREVELSKNVYKDGVKLIPLRANHGDILDYELSFRHYGDGNYTDLPMVDDLYGAQYLLVPADKNPKLAQMGLKEAVRTGADGKGIRYYALKEGTYDDVIVGVDDEGDDCTAAVITVEAKPEGETITPYVGSKETYSYAGLHTQIKWYFPELSGGDAYDVSVTYQALVDMTLVKDIYSLGNIVWLNDKRGGRLYATVPFDGGTIIGYDKNIITERGNYPEDDVTEKYSLIKPGEKVTYRLELRNENGDFSIPVSALADALPSNAGLFGWEIGKNVKLEVKTEGKVDNADALLKGEITEEWEEMGAPVSGYQYLLWKNDDAITFHGKSAAYLYITLTYPTQEEKWEQYCELAGDLENTMYVHGRPTHVTHELWQEWHVLLQKGVYGVYRRATGDQYSHQYYYSSASREYYNNRDTNERKVAYYVVVYNGSRKRLYLEDLYDELPKGFTYQRLVADSGFESSSDPGGNTSVITNAGTDLKNPLIWMRAKEDPVPITYRSARVEVVDSEEGILQLHITKGSEGTSVGYDEKEGLCYLNYNEAIVFGYLCDVGETAQTEDVAVNTVRMPYHDNTEENGLRMLTEEEVPVNGVTTTKHTDVNDGTRGIVREDGKEWLVSQVEVKRGGIIPGITKYTESYTTNTGGSDMTEKYRNGVPYDAIINWKVRMKNSGICSVTDFTFVDKMPAPYCFEGDVNLSVYGNENDSYYSGGVWGNQIWGSDKSFSERPYLFTIGKRGANDKSVKVLTNTGRSYEVPLTGESVKIEVAVLNTTGTKPQIEISLDQEKDEDGTVISEVLTMKLESRYFAIPESGYMDVTLSSRNSTSAAVSKVYDNQAFLTPNVQPFDVQCAGTLIKDGDGKPVSVSSHSPVNVTFSEVTSSLKKIEEVSDPENWTDSESIDKGPVVLSEPDSLFRYTLSVTNDTKSSIEKLILIDNLPEVNDHSPFSAFVKRGSQYTVNLSKEPGFVVTIYPPESSQETAPRVLSSDEYRLEYAKRTEFTSDDWKGTETDEWKVPGDWEDLSEVRSIRIVLEDEDPDDPSIPRGARVEVSFQAVAGEDAEPGEVANNSFGYHYRLDNYANTELEAMPREVGVKIPEVPSLQKSLVDLDGVSVLAEEDLAFRFLIYETDPREDGSSVGAAPGADLKTIVNEQDESELIAEIAESGRKFTIAECVVEAGNSASALNRKLDDLTLYTYDADAKTWTKTDEKWRWVKDRQYTIVELATEYGYRQDRWQGAGDDVPGTAGTVLTFTYHRDPVKLQILNCTNVYFLYELPSAGGIGIYWYLIGGVLLMLAAVLFLYRNKNKYVGGAEGLR